MFKSVVHISLGIVFLLFSTSDGALVIEKNAVTSLYEKIESGDTHFSKADQNRVFITFGGGSQGYRNRVNILCKEAKSLDFFTTIIGFTDEDLKKDTDFWNQHGAFITQNKRGYGYWLWKPYLISKILDCLNENDILVYLDSGCTINPNGIKRFNEYVDMLQNGTESVVAFQMHHLMEKNWTKKKLLEFVDADDEMRNSGQCIGGINMWKKNERSTLISTQWYAIASHYEFINNSRDPDEDAAFIEHRHDQSVFSLLVKKYGSIKITDRTSDIDRSENGEPFLATRISR